MTAQQQIKAIETAYKGYRFRSRLEARWAVFFDTLGVRYEYEKEGFDFGNARYLPDFYLSDGPAWVEVKPHVEQMSRREMIHAVCNCAKLCDGTRSNVILITGNPFADDYYITIWHPGQTHYEPGVCEEMPPDYGLQFVFAECRRCERELWLSTLDFGYQQTLIGDSDCDTDSPPMKHGSRIMSAYEAARGARFEFGENGARV